MHKSTKPGKSALGRLGEALIRQYFSAKGYRIIAANYRQKFGEIDLIAVDVDRTLIFIEVKTMTEWPAGLSPEDQLSASKLKKTRRIAQFFANLHPELVEEAKGWRIDLVAVVIRPSGKAQVRHYKNI